TAEGLRVNLFAFGLADQPTRLSIFFNLLQLQYSPLVILLAALGWIALLRAPRVSLREYTAGQDWIQRVYDRFEGKGEGAFLLAPWEALTPLWVEQYVRNHPLDPRDVELVYVAASSPNPWLDSVLAYFDTGPVYLADYRRQVVEGGLFRLRPDGETPPLWRVVAPGDTSLPPLQSTLNVTPADPIELLAYSLDRSALRAGETAYLTLAMRAPATPAHVVMPFARVGDRWVYRWTTDSHTLSTTWQPGEVIVERYEITLPFSMPPGEYPLTIGATDLSAGRDLQFAVERLRPQVDVSIGAVLRVDPPRLIPELSGQSILADFGAQAALASATASTDGHRVTTAWGAWTQPLVAQPGQSIQVWLDWIALQQPLDNYKVFVHLITPGEQLAAPPADFYTPLGGAFPTHLWIPKWIEGQRVSDPYTLSLPPDLPPGEYRIQVGLYGLTSNRRLHILGQDGSLAGDRVILGPVVVP
ncbi:MAG TPA: hypothetical protein VJ754_10770, partial [Anaerolineae bacterium]|nr:hypothetical protein [Anaerolineae bacterium]